MVQPNNRLIADVTYKPLVGPGLNPASGAQATTMLENFVSQIIGFLTLCAVIFFGIQIILAGYGFISSQGDEKKLEINRSKLTNGVMGMFIVVVAVGITSLLAKLLGLDNPLDLEKMFTLMGL